MTIVATASRSESFLTGLRAHAVGAPDAMALEACDAAPLSFRDLVRQLDAGRQQLIDLGVGATDRVALILPDGVAAAVAFMTVTSHGIAAPINPAMPPPAMAEAVRRVRATWAIVLPDLAEAMRAAIVADGGARLIELVRDPSSTGTYEFRGTSRARELGGHPGPPTCDDVALVLQTSGTTSRTKVVLLTHGNLAASAHSIAAALALGPRVRSLVVMPLYHIHGLVGGLLAPLAAGGAAICTPGFNAARFQAWLAEFRPTWYSAVPTMHHAIVERASELHLERMPSALRFIRSASAPLPRPLLDRLERTFGVPVVEAYGMTEAAHQIACNPLPPSVRKPGSVGLATGPEIAVVNQNGRRVADGNAGEVVVRGPSITPGYDDDPEANRAAFVEGWLRTGDLGYRDGDGYLFLIGRLKEVINRAGEKIAPREIDEVLLSHPAVAEAATFGVWDRRLGESVAAAVVPRTGEDVTPRQLREWVAVRLPFFKVPERIAIVSSIPKGPTGKVQRHRLGSAIDIPASDRNENDGIAVDAVVLDAVLSLAGEVLAIDCIDAGRSFLDCGGDSVLIAQFVARLRETFAVNITLIDVFDAASLHDLAGTILRRMAPQPWRSETRTDV